MACPDRLEVNYPDSACDTNEKPVPSFCYAFRVRAESISEDTKTVLFQYRSEIDAIPVLEESRRRNVGAGAFLRSLPVLYSDKAHGSRAKHRPHIIQNGIYFPLRYMQQYRHRPEAVERLDPFRQSHCAHVHMP